MIASTFVSAVSPDFNPLLAPIVLGAAKITLQAAQNHFNDLEHLVPQSTGGASLNSPPPSLVPISSNTETFPSLTLVVVENASAPAWHVMFMILVAFGVMVGAGSQYIRTKSGFIFTPDASSKRDPKDTPPGRQSPTPDRQYQEGDKDVESSGGEDSEEEDGEDEEEFYSEGRDEEEPSDSDDGGDSIDDPPSNDTEEDGRSNDQGDPGGGGGDPNDPPEVVAFDDPKRPHPSIGISIWEWVLFLLLCGLNGLGLYRRHIMTQPAKPVLQVEPDIHRNGPKTHHLTTTLPLPEKAPLIDAPPPVSLLDAYPPVSFLDASPAIPLDEAPQYESFIIMEESAAPDHHIFKKYAGWAAMAMILWEAWVAYAVLKATTKTNGEMPFEIVENATEDEDAYYQESATLAILRLYDGDEFPIPFTNMPGLNRGNTNMHSHESDAESSADTYLRLSTTTPGLVCGNNNTHDECHYVPGSLAESASYPERSEEALADSTIVSFPSFEGVSFSPHIRHSNTCNEENPSTQPSELPLLRISPDKFHGVMVEADDEEEDEEEKGKEREGDESIVSSNECFEAEFPDYGSTAEDIHGCDERGTTENLAENTDHNHTTAKTTRQVDNLGEKKMKLVVEDHSQMDVGRDRELAMADRYNARKFVSAPAPALHTNTPCDAQPTADNSIASTRTSEEEQWEDPNDSTTLDPENIREGFATMYRALLSEFEETKVVSKKRPGRSMLETKSKP